MKKNKNIEDMEFVMVRTNSAGVFYGYLEKREGSEVILRDARRVWYWEGAASLSQLAMEGTKAPSACKFPCAVDKVVLLEVIEIITISDEAKESLNRVPIWTA